MGILDSFAECLWIYMLHILALVLLGMTRIDLGLDLVWIHCGL